MADLSIEEVTKRVYGDDTVPIHCLTCNYPDCIHMTCEAD